jgi:hypothetical protein
VSASAWALALVVGAAPPVQRPSAVAPSPTVPDPGEPPAPSDAPAAAPTDAPTDAPATEAAPTEPADAPDAAIDTPTADEETFSIAPAERPGPPYYDERDLAALRQRHHVEANPPPPPPPVRWRCLIADPRCATTFEINATSAYALRFKQDNVNTTDLVRWNSGRAQYDLWVNLPVLVETRGRTRYTKMTLGPKAGAIVSDTGDTWGNVGMAMRYWFGRGRWAPALEITSALSFKLARRDKLDPASDGDPKLHMQRGPVGFTMDVGVGIGGFGAIIIGGQYDSPFAREDVPERFRTQAAGTFFIGFRGNILWGGPAAAAVLTHTLTQRYARDPRANF